jgi:hypothetical protein
MIEVMAIVKRIPRKVRVYRGSIIDFETGQEIATCRVLPDNPGPIDATLVFKETPSRPGYVYSEASIEMGTTTVLCGEAEVRA